MDEEKALYRYLDQFGITASQVDDNGVLTTMVQAAVIGDIAEGIVPQRQNITGRISFNLMKSETLVWVMQDVDYLETVVRRERRGSSHGLSIRVARGVYYRPSTFRSRNVEWEETAHQDTGLLGFTTKHLYSSGSRQQKEIPGQMRSGGRPRALRLWFRADARRPDREATFVRDRGRMVPLKPGGQPGADAGTRNPVTTPGRNAVGS